MVFAALSAVVIVGVLVWKTKSVEVWRQLAEGWKEQSEELAEKLAERDRQIVDLRVQVEALHLQVEQLKIRDQAAVLAQLAAHEVSAGKRHVENQHQSATQLGVLEEIRDTLDGIRNNQSGG